MIPVGDLPENPTLITFHPCVQRSATHTDARHQKIGDRAGTSRTRHRKARALVLEDIAATDGTLDARLFTGPRGGRVTPAVLRDATGWDDVVTKLGYEHLRRHDLRHTGLTWMADAGVPVHHLRKIAGHASLNTTQRYLHPDRQSVTDAGAMLSSHLRRSTGGPQTEKRIRMTRTPLDHEKAR